MQDVSSSPAASQSVAPRGARALGIVAIGVTLLIVAYWTIWYGGGRELLASSHTREYLAFENAFPAADAWLALTAFIAGVQLLRGRSSAIFWLFLTAGSGLYLGLMDVLFDLENGIYLVSRGGDPVAIGIEIAINILTFALSLVVLLWAWRNRGWMTSA
ncbi:MAG TPA: hypothetical protein VH349_11970 [Ktedonobacterales bacterium]|jgi:hypothetical protein